MPFFDLDLRTMVACYSPKSTITIFTDSDGNSSLDSGLIDEINDAIRSQVFDEIYKTLSKDEIFEFCRKLFDIKDAKINESINQYCVFDDVIEDYYLNNDDDSQTIENSSSNSSDTSIQKMFSSLL